MLERLKRLILGSPRDIKDPEIFDRISLIAFLAWVGLGADGLSSSCYGPEESFRVLGAHTSLAVFVAIATALTVFIIAYAYSRVIEHFPFGGGGYTVATKLLGPSFGLVSGCALLADYFLTITVSIVSGTDAFFSFLSPGLSHWKLAVETALIIFMTLMNLRGVKESIKILAPIFILFLVTHATLIFGTFFLHARALPQITSQVGSNLGSSLTTLGLAGMTALFLRAYAMGAGTYTGIEAVSNGLQIMREPKVETGKRTMLYMAVSLAVTAGGIILCYLLVDVHAVPGQTMNAALISRFIARTGLSGTVSGHGFLVMTLVAEAALLVIAAQAGFVDGPRIMANMAHDSWMPHRFGTLSDRLTVQDGVLVMSLASLFLLWDTHGDITTLVVMYSINVFVTFSLTQAAMIRFWLRGRKTKPDWKNQISIHVVGFVLCAGMLVLNMVIKFAEGGWETMLITSGIISLCLLIRAHYLAVKRKLSRLDDILTALPENSRPTAAPTLDPKAPTAVVLVGGYGGLGIHSLLAIQRLFPNYFKNFVFISVGVIDSASFHGVGAVDDLRQRTEDELKRYVGLARNLGLAADYRLGVSTEVVEEAERLSLEISREYSRSVVFAGKLVFEQERWFQRVLHNETGYQLQRRLQFSGINTMVLPVRVLSGLPAKVPA
ncbi:MAG TPA: APC family permease [Elusimicrobiota bacterium]|nr:APC family permease [Elusimicrobiota bacterium]